MVRKNLFFLLTTFTTCLALQFFGTAVTAGEINLSAAASLKETLTELAAAFCQDHPGVTVEKNFGSSGALAKQIENGAPADLFISANQEWLSYLSEKNLLAPGSTAILARNSLVFVGRENLRITTLPELAQLERVAIGSPKSVPAGDYARQALVKSGLDPLMAKKLVLARDVRECLLYAERGEVDGAFVYRTDALLAKNARILFTVPPELHAPIVYPLGLTLTGAQSEEATQFMHSLQSPAAQAILQKYGFAVP